LVIKEIAFTSHTDVLAAFFLLASIERLASKRAIPSAVLLALAVATRFFTIVFVPVLLWRQQKRTWAIFAAVLAAAYLPFALSGSSDAASMKTFAAGWEFNSFGFAVFRDWLGPV